MGTSAGNYGRAMYHDPKWLTAVSKSQTLERIKVKKNCEKCGDEFEVERKIKEGGTYSKKWEGRRFCRKCSNSRTENREEINKKISKSLWKGGSKKYYCAECNKCIGNNQSGLCRKCLNKRIRLNMDKLKAYRKDCSFDFNLSDYQDEFNFELVEEYGWYKASNHGDNLDGVSRDHIVSVKYGFDNDVSPEIISHPANCRLITQRENSSKWSKSLISFEELQRKIDEWEAKYNR